MSTTALPPATGALQPTALPLIQSKAKPKIGSSRERLRAAAHKYEDNIFSESKRYAPNVLRYTKRRDPPVSSALKRPIKRYHSAHTRPRRRPKPNYGPPNYGVPNPLNEYSLAGDIYDPAMYKVSSGGRSSGEKGSYPPGIVETDIGKFYDASASFGTNSFKTSYKPFGTSLLSPSSLFGGVSDYKLGDANSALTNSESSPSGTYPASASSFDASTFNLYQPDMIYPTAPHPPSSVNGHDDSHIGVPRLTSSYDPPKKPVPPSTSYGVPLAPSLSSYAIDSSKNSYHIPLSGGGYIPTNYAQRPVSNLEGSSSRGNFAEPPVTRHASPGQGNSFRSKPATNPYPNNAFDAPYQFHIQQTKSKEISPPPNANELSDFDDDQYESSTNTEDFAQPMQPNAYEQEQYETFAKQRRKILRQQQQQQQQPKYVNRFEEFSSFFEGPEENVRKVKKTRKKPAPKAVPRPTRPPPPPPAQASEDEEENDYEEAPDEDYLDEIVGRPTKRTTRYRKKRPRTTATPHVLDTDDLRDAFSSGSVKYSMAVQPNDLGTPLPTKRSKHSQKSQRKNFSNASDEDNMAPQIRAAQRPHLNSDQFDIISIQKSHSQTLYDGTQAPPVWHSLPTHYETSNSIPSVQSRFDIQQRFDINDVIRRPTKRPASGAMPNHNYNSVPNYTMNKHQYDDEEQDHDRADTFDQLEVQTDNGIGTVNEETTLRTTTSYATPGTTLWDGKTLPKNHKMA